MFPPHPQHSMTCASQKVLSNPRKAGARDRGSPCPSAAGTGSSHAAPPGLSPPGQNLDKKVSGEQRPHFPLQGREASTGETMALLGSKRAGPRLGTKAEPQLGKNDNLLSSSFCYKGLGLGTSASMCAGPLRPTPSSSFIPSSLPLLTPHSSRNAA